MSALTPFRFGALLLLLEIAYVAAAAARTPRPDAFLVGDCPYYAAAAESLARDGDFELRNQLPGDLADHNGFYALATDGRIVPKHPTLMPLLSVPFYLALGRTGFLVFNVAQVLALVVGVAVLAGNTPAARLLALAGYATTPLLPYTYNFSPDVLGAVLVVWAFVLAARGRAGAAGLLAGLAVWAKVYLALVLLPLAVVVLPQGWRPTVRCAAGALLAVAPMLLLNAHFFGAPWVTGYDREAHVTADGFRLAGHYSRFNQPFLAGLGNLLFDGRNGMLRTAPLWVLWPAGLWAALARRDRAAARVACAAALAVLANLFVFAPYDEWAASSYGNRFLFPALALGLALQGPLWERVLRRGREEVAQQPPAV